MRINKYIILAIFSFASCFSAQSQLTVDQEISAEDAVQQLVGAGVSISNVVVTAADSSWAYYNNVNTEMADGEGLLLTTGNAINSIVVNGENPDGPLVGSTGCLNCDEFDNNFPGSSLLNSIYAGNTFDATTFQFDVTVQGDSLDFKFSFASEEYLEWVGSSFNDVFGFFISGPGGFNDQNIALVPGTSDAVAINSVNHILNSEYFYDNRNPLGQNIQYDGFTVGLQAQVGGLTPCETYTIKLIIADRSDRIYDSAVFIEQLNSNFSDIITSTNGGTPYMIEGCNDGQITFIPDEVLNVDQEILYSFGGTADILSDYTVNPALGNNIPNVTQTITIPANEESVTVDVSTVADNITEGDEYITLYVINEVCDVETQDSVLFFIQDSLELDIFHDLDEICPGDSLTLTGISNIVGDYTFSWDPASEVSQPNSLITEVYPTVNTVYTLSSSLSFCTAEASTEIKVKEIDIIIDVTPVNCSGLPIGEIDVTISNATEPYTVEWTDSNSNVLSQNEDITGLNAGIYTITVTDSDGCDFSQDIEVFEENTLVSNLTLSNFNGCNISCNGICDGAASVFPQGGIGPYTVTWNVSVPPNTLNIQDLCPGAYSVTIEDSDGCLVTEDFTIVEPEPLEGALVSVTEILCNGTSTGVAEVTATGGKTPYAYSWSDDPSGTPLLGQGPMLENLGDGTYFVTVTDANNCVASNSVVVTVQPPPPPVSVALSSVLYPNGFHTTCFDSADGSITSSVSGGVPGYSYLWTDSDNNIISSNPNISNLTCGEYTLAVVDDNGCEEIESFNVTCPSQISIDISVTPNPCNDPLASNGEIDITPSGGTGVGYTYSWVDQDNVSFGNNEDLTNLPSGVYTVTITDSDGCIRTFTIPVTNEDSIVITVEDSQILSCFDSCDGFIDISIAGAVGNYTVEWSDLDGFVSNNEDLLDVCAGTYFLVVTGEDDCQATETFVLSETSEIVIDVIEALDPTCFGQNSGSIDISYSGGDGPLEIEWLPTTGFSGSTDEDISQLIDGTYTAVVTDTSTGCQATEEITIQGPMAINIDIQLSSFDGGFNVSCNGSTDGWANAAASGGNPDFTNLPNGYFYDWSNLPAGNDPSLPNQANLPGGVSYGLIVTDTAGCQGEILIPISAPDILETQEQMIPVSCNGLNDGMIIPNISGGSGNYTSLVWTGDIGTNEVDADTLFNLSPGTYTLEVIDSNDCTFSEDFEVTEPDTLEVDIVSITQEDCFESSTASIAVDGIGGTNPYSFEWIDDDMNTYAGNVLTNILAGTYYLTVTDSNDCVAIDTIEINSDQVFTLDIDLFQIGSGAYTLACLGDSTGSALANVGGGIPDYDYTWTNTSNVIVGTEATVSDLAAGTYYIDVSDQSGCLLNDSIIVTEPLSALEAEGNITSFISCFDECTGEIEVSASGGDPDYTYIWELNEEEFSFNNSEDSLCAGIYEVLVTDANGCDTLISFNLTQPEMILVDVTLTEYNCGFNVSCFGETDGQISIETTGGVPNPSDPEYTYDWTGNLGSNSADSDTLFNVGVGSYILSVTDNAGCEIDTTVVLQGPDQFVLNALVTDISCFGDANGQIDANPSGGCEPYSYSWSNTIDDVQTIDNLDEGNYELTITDANGCLDTGNFDISEPELLTVSAQSVATTCGLSDGAIDSTPGGGTQPYNFDWDNGADDIEDPSGLASGTYTLTLTDDRGCDITLPVTVDSSNGIEYTSTVTDVLCFGDTDGCVEIDVTGSNGAVTQTWTDASGNIISEPCPVGTGSYTVEMEDEEGCETQETFTINSPDSISIELTAFEYNNGFNISTFEGTDGSIEADVSGGTMLTFYTYSWSNGDSVEDIEDLSAGDYILTVTDDNGCENSESITLTQPEDLTLPTGLTPNNDGFNDTYVILGLTQYDNVEITVFNRWGNKVYENNNYNNSWSGLNDNGDELADGTYYVVAVGTKNGETKELSSFVDLRR